MSAPTIIKMSEVEAGLCKSAMAGAPGEVLLDIVTDQLVLSEQLTAEESKGAGKVLKFLRSLHNDSDHLIKAPSTES